MRRRIRTAAAALVLCWAGLTAGVPAEEKGAQGAGVRIGLVRTLFRDVSPALAQVSMQPFASLMRSQTGVAGEPALCGDALSLGRDLQDGKVQFGVFHGVEFAWAQEKYPELRPLVIVINRQRHLRATLVVRYDSPIKDFADLKGKTVALPRRSREHCHLFFERQCRQLGAVPKEFFKDVVAHPTVEDALDDVLRRKVDAVVADNVSLAGYELLKPGCYSGLKVVQRSCVFPAAVVAYREGGVDEGTLARVHTGLIKANRDVRGKELMSMWKLTAFEAVPADFSRTLAGVIREYPCPAAEPANAVAAPAQE